MYTSNLPYVYGAYYFNPSNLGFAIIPSSVQSAISGKTSMTISLWFKFNTTTTSGNYALFSLYDNGSIYPNKEWLYIYLTNTGNPSDLELNVKSNMDLGGGLTGRLNNNSTISSTSTNWYNVKIVITNSGFQAYINSNLQTLLTPGPSTFNLSSPLNGSIGTAYSGGGPNHETFTGYMGAVHMWDSELTSEEVNIAYNNVKATGLYP
jgi:hypothetical protein